MGCSRLDLAWLVLNTVQVCEDDLVNFLNSDEF